MTPAAAIAVLAVAAAVSRISGNRTAAAITVLAAAAYLAGRATRKQTR